jgi:hypothetical protein
MMEGRCCGVLRLGFVAVASVGGLALATPASGGAMTGESLALRLAQPKPLFLDRAVITTSVNLRRIGVVRATFECRSCTFVAGIDARHVIFEREFDLGGAEVRGPLDFASASFAGPLLLGNDALTTRVHGPVSFRLASFSDMADMERVLVRGTADFSLARFRDRAVFTAATFAGTATFAGVSFDERARFDHGSFTSNAGFDHALFGSGADFRSRVFNRDGDFTAADFRGVSDFGQSTFNGVAVFDDARFEQDATFRGATFAATAHRDDDRALSFGHTVALGKLDFSSATFDKFVLAENVVARALSFDDVTFVEPALITLAGLKIDDLRYPLRDVNRVVDESQQREILRQIESSAKSRGDMGLANDAHYRLQELTARGYGPLARAADAVLYRGIAGYFVRPLRPLAVLLALAVALSLVRWFSRPHSGTANAIGRARRAVAARVGAGEAGTRGPARAKRTWRWHAGFATEVFDTFALVLPRLRGGAEPEEPRATEQREAPGGKQQARSHGTGRRLEILAYRVLLVCALLGFANSNPTLRQMFDAIV